MERTEHNIATLFAQLGQGSDEWAIDRFIASHSPIPDGMQLHEAKFWTTAQASFLRDAILEDGEWSDAVDKLNLQLHSRH